MAEAKAQSEWAHTSAIMALIANVNRDPKKSRSFSPIDFNPLAAHKGNRVKGRTNDLSILKDVFVDRNFSGVGRKLEQ